MLLWLPPLDGHGVQPRVKNGPPLAGHGAEAVRDEIARVITTLPDGLRRSLSWDQGAEMAQHAQIRIDTGLESSFCDPQSPWQRGTNANTDGLLRQYFPKRHRPRPPQPRRPRRRRSSSQHPAPKTLDCVHPPKPLTSFYALPSKVVL